MFIIAINMTIYSIFAYTPRVVKNIKHIHQLLLLSHEIVMGCLCLLSYDNKNLLFFIGVIIVLKSLVSLWLMVAFR